jgi:hypothetical protein
MTYAALTLSGRLRDADSDFRIDSVQREFVFRNSLI